jgi:putative PIN family toxin of toxin-antitoxin system
MQLEKMQKVIIDTNVIVSSLIQKSFPYKIMYELFIEDKMELCVPKALMKEYYDVLRRPKFAIYYVLLQGQNYCLTILKQRQLCIIL